MPTPPYPRVAALVLLLFPLAVAIGFPVAILFPQTWRGEANTVVSTPIGLISIWASVNGRGSSMTVRGAQVYIPGAGANTGQAFHFDPDAMTLQRQGGAHRHNLPIPVNQRWIAVVLVQAGTHVGDLRTQQAAGEIVTELESLRENGWPPARFRYEISGEYLIDPDDRFGPFFWLPNYAPACLPVWIIVSLWLARPLVQKYRSALNRLQQYDHFTVDRAGEFEIVME